MNAKLTKLGAGPLTVTCSGCSEAITGTCADGESIEVCAERIRRPHKDACIKWRPRKPRPTGVQRQTAYALVSSERWLQRIVQVMEDGEPETFAECFLPRAFRVWLHRRAREQRRTRWRR